MAHALLEAMNADPLSQAETEEQKHRPGPRDDEHTQIYRAIPNGVAPLAQIETANHMSVQALVACEIGGQGRPMRVGAPAGFEPPSGSGAHELPGRRSWAVFRVAATGPGAMAAIPVGPHLRTVNE